MRAVPLVQIVLLVVLALATSGCQLVGDIFQAGMWVGIIGVVLVIVLIGWVVSRIIG